MRHFDNRSINQEMDPSNCYNIKVEEAFSLIPSDLNDNIDLASAPGSAVCVDHVMTGSTSSKSANEIEKNLEWCTLCKVEFSGPEVAFQHYAGKRHAKNKAVVKPCVVTTQSTQLPMTMFSTSPSSESSSFVINNEGEQSLSHCVICDIHFTGSFAAEQHYAGKKHAKKLAPPNPIHTEFCTTCNIHLLGKEQAESHYAGKKHLKSVVNAKKLPAVSSPSIQKANLLVDTEVLKELVTPPPNFSLFKTTPMSLEKMVTKKLQCTQTCVVCSKTFNGTAPIRDHALSKKHLKKIFLLQKSLEKMVGISFEPGHNVLPHVLRVVEQHSNNQSIDDSIDAHLLTEISLHDLIESVMDKASDRNVVDEILSTTPNIEVSNEAIQKQEGASSQTTSTVGPDAEPATISIEPPCLPNFENEKLSPQQDASEPVVNCKTEEQPLPPPQQFQPLPPPQQFQPIANSVKNRRGRARRGHFSNNDAAPKRRRRY